MGPATNSGIKTFRSVKTMESKIEKLNDKVFRKTITREEVQIIDRTKLLLEKERLTKRLEAIDADIAEIDAIDAADAKKEKAKDKKERSTGINI